VRAPGVHAGQAAGRQCARWLHVLAHEIVHAIQQAQGIARTGGFWEPQAEAGAMAVTTGRVYPDLGLQPPGRGHGAAVLAGFNSWEHRLIGDVTGVDLVRIATRTAGWQDVVAQQIGLGSSDPPVGRYRCRIGTIAT